MGEEWTIEDNSGTNKGYLRLLYRGQRVADFFPFAADTDPAFIKSMAVLIKRTMNGRTRSVTPT